MTSVRKKLDPELLKLLVGEDNSHYDELQAFFSASWVHRKQIISVA